MWNTPLVDVKLQAVIEEAGMKGSGSNINSSHLKVGDYHPALLVEFFCNSRRSFTVLNLIYD